MSKLMLIVPLSKGARPGSNNNRWGDHERQGFDNGPNGTFNDNVNVASHRADPARIDYSGYVPNASNRAHGEATPGQLREKTSSRTASNPVTEDHIMSAVGDSFPDGDPYDQLAEKFPSLASQDGKNGSLLMDKLDATSKKMGYKDFNDYKAQTWDENSQSYADATGEEVRPNPWK